MEIYKLLKDLPTFKAGSLFEMEDGSLYYYTKSGDSHWQPKVMAYHKKTLNRFPNILEDWFEKVEDRPWEPKYGDDFWFLDEGGEVCHMARFSPNIVHSCNMIKIGNYFPNEIEAEDAAEWIKAFKTLRDDTKGFKPDYKQRDIEWCSVAYDLMLRKLMVSRLFDDVGNPIVFETTKDAHKSIETHPQEWLTFLSITEDQK